jgi:mono/diheme cytochrome c family protein
LVASAEILPNSPGKSLYDQHCRACHQGNANGAPGMIPPLRGTDWVTGDKDRLINVVLNGLNEPLEINGESYQNAMPAMAYLSDEEIAQVLTFIRTNFGNNASPITADEVKNNR